MNFEIKEQSMVIKSYMAKELNNKTRKEILRWRAFRRKGVFVCGFLLTVAVFFMAGTSNAGGIKTTTFKSSENRSRDAKRLRTDGQIVFSVPKGFRCTDSIIGNTKVFFLEDKQERNITINSIWNVDDSPESINSIYKDLSNEEGMDGMEYTVIEDTMVSDKRCTRYIKVRKYTGDGFVVFWRFAVLIDKTTGKACLVSAYDQGNDDYLEQLLESVRFFN